MRLLPVILFLAACNSGNLEESINFVDVGFDNVSRFHVQVFVEEGVCVDPTSLSGSTFGGLQADYVVTESPSVRIVGPSDPVLTEFTEDEACDGLIGFGFNDVSSLAGQEEVMLTMTGDNESFEMVFRDHPATPWDLTPSTELSLSTLWGSTVTFTMDGPHEILPEAVASLGYPEPDDQFELTDLVVTADTITVTFPDTNPVSTAVPFALSFHTVVEYTLATPYGPDDSISAEGFWPSNQTWHGMSLLISE